MDFWWWILLAAAVVIVATVVVSRRAVRSGPDPTQITIAPDVIARIEKLCAQGRSVEAIALLRQETGLNLLHARTIVDRVDRRRRQRSTPAGSAGSAGTAASGAPVRSATGPAAPPPDVEQPSVSEIDLDTELHARSLAAEGRRTDAVNLVRARTDWDAEQAARFVDSL